MGYLRPLCMNMKFDNLRYIKPKISISIDSKMPSHSMFKSAQEISCFHHVVFNPLLLFRFALDLLHLTLLEKIELLALNIILREFCLGHILVHDVETPTYPFQDSGTNLYIFQIEAYTLKSTFYGLFSYNIHVPYVSERY